MQTGPCAVLPFLSGQRDTLHHPHPSLHHLTSRNTHQGTQHRHSPWCTQQRDDNGRREGIGQRAKVGQHRSTNTLIEVATNTMALKHTGLWLIIEGLVGMADIDNDKVFDTKPSHTHPLHPTTNPPPLQPSSLSNSNPLPSAHSTTHPSPFAQFASHISFDCG